MAVWFQGVRKLYLAHDCAQFSGGRTILSWEGGRGGCG